MEDNSLQIYQNIKEYCNKYNIPVENLLDILEDQKVLPMIRGKATEFVATIFLKRILNQREWQVQKLNLNAQPGKYDEDISITFSRTGYRLKVEVKNAVRGSFRLGQKTKIKHPHFKVKCHKSRSNIKLQHTTNDRYLVDEFDLLICNISNAVFRNKSLEADLPLIDDKNVIKWLKSYYKVKEDNDLIRCTYDDWRFCLPHTIAGEDHSIPRTPTVLMSNDPHWFTSDQLESRLKLRIKDLLMG